jgi:putative transposase
VVGVSAACATLGVPRSTYYRLRTPKFKPIRPPLARRRHPRALSSEEQALVRATLNSDRFVDLSPRAVYATLLDQGIRYCHWRSMYRLLQLDQATRERRALRRHRVYTRPELLATAPGQVWSWDITLLRGPHPGQWYRLYVILDIFSRFVVGWLVAEHEETLLAERLIADACAREQIEPNQLTVHADRGAVMTSKVLAELMLDLGITRSHSRPSVSNDNPYSEAQFKTLKYGQSYPERFESLAETQSWVADFVNWYNTEHRHSGIGLLTPEVVHRGRAEAVTNARQQVLERAYAAHPERFVGGQPRAPKVPEAAWINPPSKTVLVPNAATPAIEADSGSGSRVSAAKAAP